MGVVLTSTTEPQANLDHAASDAYRDPAALDQFKLKLETPADETQTDVQPADETNTEGDKGAAAKKEEVPEPPKPQAKKPSQKEQARIDELTKRWKTEESEKVKERAEKEELKRQLAIARGEVADPTLIPEEEPILENYRAQGRSDEEWQNDKVLWLDKVISEGVERKSYEERLLKESKRFTDWNEALEEANKSGIEFLNKNTGEAVKRALRKEENAADVVYYLWKHLDEARDMAAMTPEQATLKLGKIIAKIGATSSATPAVEKPKVIPPPPPITPVGAAATRGVIPMDQLSGAEYVRQMNKREFDKKRGRV